MTFQQLIGLSGVDTRESQRAQFWGGIFERLLLAIALLIVVQWYLESVSPARHAQTVWIDWLIWLFFVVELLVLTALVEDRWRYLRGNWMNLAIVATGLPVFWQGVPLPGGVRALRLLLLVGLLPRISLTVRRLLSRNKLGYTLIVVTVFVVLAGFVMSAVDPAIESPIDGIWWGLVTVTTVGYGDVVPVSGQGRFFAGVLMVLGVILLATLTANVAAYLIDSEIDSEQTVIIEKLERLEQRLNRIETLLEARSHHSGTDS
ncbi:MAG: potassium channel family protein [Pseudomonadota bacterium]